jgi:CRP-like cAMP-binding protein
MSPTTEAFILGLVSACSLPLGALSARIWRPQERIIAFLMAFGGGALLAALTIDLVAAAVSRGHFYPLAAGCVLGGLLFIALNQIVNDHGGFLRKSSTTMWYFRRQARRRFKRILAHVHRLQVFDRLESWEAEQLANVVVTRDVAKGTTLYQKGDPSEFLYVVDEGEVDLLDPKDDMRPFQRLGPNDAFGRMAFLTGAPHATVSVTTKDTRLWLLPREQLAEILRTSTALPQSLERELTSGEVARYLVERQGATDQEAEQWVAQAVRNVREGVVPGPATQVDRKESEFLGVANRIHRLPLFQMLSNQDARRVAGRIFLKRHESGHTFFHQNEPADRMYVIEHGEVVLIDPRNRTRRPTRLHDHDAFGGMSFLTGAAHAVTAVASEETSVWVLRKRDFDELVLDSHSLARAIRGFLEQEEVVDYLAEKHEFGAAKATRWVRQAVGSMDTGRNMIPASEMSRTLTEHKGAPLAIWLGILLDGIPESLVIGSSLIHSQVSLSLMAGLFISNYPEALSSSVGMRQQGFRFSRILLMWTSLMLITGIGAAVGNLFFQGAPPFLFAIVEGVAAGSMLTMIAETMLPEAYFKGGSIVGFATLLGFLAAIFFKVLDPAGH